MKFQKSSIHGFKVMLCIKKRDERTNGRTDGRTNNPEAICPSNFFEVGGIKNYIPPLHILYARGIKMLKITKGHNSLSIFQNFLKS